MRTALFCLFFFDPQQLRTRFGPVGIVTFEAPGLHLGLGMLGAGPLDVAGRADGLNLRLKTAFFGGGAFVTDRLVTYLTPLGPCYFRRHRAVQISGPGQLEVTAIAQTALPGEGRTIPQSTKGCKQKEHDDRPITHKKTIDTAC